MSLSSEKMKEAVKPQKKGIGKSEIDLAPLYRWYKKNKRDLPFRNKSSPYEVWVSEIMLQQTRVGAMLESYKKFLASFPNVEALAQAPLDEVLIAWRGLGYYSRARNLHKGAKHILKHHKGLFPKELKSALAIPGVGPYTAAAVLSISYAKPIAVLDGNVSRVLSRLYHIPQPSSSLIEERAQNLMEKQGKKKPAEHNQAMMEFGALFCAPKNPDCPQCPLADACLSYKKGNKKSPRLPPSISPKQKLLELELKLWFLFSHDGKSLLILKEKHSRFFKNLWFLPYAYNYQRKAKKSLPFCSAPHFPEIIHSLPLGKRQKFPQKIRHSITHHNITAQVEAIYLNCPKKELLRLLNSSPKKGEKDTRWMWVQLAQLRKYLLSSLGDKALRVLETL